MTKKDKKNKDLDHKKLTFAYVPGTTLMHRLNPISKLVFLILLTVTIFFIKSLILLAIIAILIILLALLSGISFWNLIRKMRFLIPIFLISILLNIFFNATSADDIVLFYLFGLPFLPIRRLAVYYAFRAFLFVMILYTSALIYTYTTSPKDFVYSLMRLRIQYRYCFAFIAGMNYIPRIEEEAKTIALAQKARGFGLKKANTVKKAYKLVTERMVSTLVSILRKGHTTSISMENRCFGVYKERTNLIEVKYKKKDFAFIIICCLIFTLILLYIFGLIPLPPIPSLYELLFA